MIVGDFCLKETPYSEVAFWLPLSNLFICVRTVATAFYSQSKFTIFIHLLNYFLFCYFYNQTRYLFAFILREWSEWAQCYSCDKQALSFRPPWSSLKIIVYNTRYIPAAWYLRNSALLWCYLELFRYHPNNGC